MSYCKHVHQEKPSWTITLLLTSVLVEFAIGPHVLPLWTCFSSECFLFMPEKHEPNIEPDIDCADIHCANFELLKFQHVQWNS